MRADLNETSSVWLFPTPKEPIKEIKKKIGGGRKIEILGPVGLKFPSRKSRLNGKIFPFLRNFPRES